MLKFKKYSKKIKKYMQRGRLLKAFNTNVFELERACLKHLNPVTCPIILISQIQRSGGSLLSQLFDFHPQLHAHPYELKIGYPKKYNWPEINLNDGPRHWFDILFEDDVIKHFENGYKKEPTSDDTFPFIFLPYLQRKIFLHFVKSMDPIKTRDVFNAYMTSYFGAWLNNSNYHGNKRYVSGFTPRLSEQKNNMEKFFGIYADGRLISIIRNPKNWFPSAFRHNRKIKKDKYSNINVAIDQWKQNTEAIIRNKELYKQKVCVIRFEDLIQKTERVVKHLSNFLEIEYNPILLVPTFNGIPIRANTSFDENREGIIKNTVERYKTLSSKEIGVIEQETSVLYDRALKLADVF
ncbi:MAG: sulfotransferase [Desulfobacterales bacterium]|jgi:hypothetical protein